MRFWHVNMHFEIAILVFHNFVVCLLVLLRLKVFRSITFKYLRDSNAEYSDVAV